MADSTNNPKDDSNTTGGTPGNPSMAGPFPGMGQNPMMAGAPYGLPPGFNPAQPGAPMQGGPMPPPGMMPPMPGTSPMQQQGSGDLFTSVGNMLRLGVDAINAALAGSNQIMQAFMGGGQGMYPYAHGYPYHYGHGHYGHGHHGHHHCCSQQRHDHYHDSWCHSCCDVYGQGCCNPGVHGCS